MTDPEGSNNQGDAASYRTYEKPQMRPTKPSPNLKKKPPSHQAAKTQEDQQPSQKELASGAKKQNWYSEISLPDWITAISTLVIMIWAGLQWHEMRIGGADTHDLAVAANSQAKEAKAQVDKLTESLRKTDALIDQAKGQADATRKLANASVLANVNAIEAERPWMGAAIHVEGFFLGSKPTSYAIFMNTGRRPARITRAAIFGHLFRTFPPKALALLAQQEKLPSHSIIVPGGTVTTPATVSDTVMAEDLRDLESGRWKYFILAGVEYGDVQTNARYWTRACVQYIPSEKGFRDCTEEFSDAK